MLQLKINHSYYMDGKSNNDFVIMPSPLSRQLLDDYGFVFRQNNNGFNLYVEVVPDSDPFELFKSIGDASFKLCFYMLTVNSNVHTMSNLPDYKAGKEVFYFSNLNDFSGEGDELIIGDSVAEQAIGNPLGYVRNSVYNYQFSVPVTNAKLEIKNIFGDSVYSKDVSAQGDGGVINEFRVDLDVINNFIPGRYTISDDQGGHAEFYYAPMMSGEPVLGVIEVFNDTVAFTGDSSDKVPEIYRFIRGNELAGIDSYIISMQARSTKWRYIVENKYQANGINLQDLEITGVEEFTEVEVPGFAVFLSNELISFHENPLALKLVGEDEKNIRSLPSPSQSTQLKFNSESNQYESHMYVYV